MSGNTILLTVIWFLTLAGSIAAYVKPSDPPPDDSYVATVQARVGDVQYRTAYSSSWRKVLPGALVSAGTVISTKAKSSVVVLTKDGHVLSIAENSQIVLSGLERDQRNKLLVSLVSGNLAVKPIEVVDSKPRGFLSRIKRADVLPTALTNIVEQSMTEVKKPIEIATGKVTFEVNRSADPVVVSSQKNDVRILSNSNNVVARIEGKKDVIVPKDTPITVQSADVVPKLVEDQRASRVRELVSLATQIQKVAAAVQVQKAAVESQNPLKGGGRGSSAQGLSLNQAQTLLDAEEAAKNSQKAKESNVIASQPQWAVNEIVLIATDRDFIDYKPPVIRTKPVAVSTVTVAMVEPMTKLTALPGPKEVEDLNQPRDLKVTSKEVEKKPTEVPSPTTDNGTQKLKGSVATPPPKVEKTPDKKQVMLAALAIPIQNKWKLEIPSSQVHLYVFDRKNLNRTPAMNLEVKHLGGAERILHLPNLEFYSSMSPTLKIRLKPENTRLNSKSFRFSLTGSDLAKLTTSSQGSAVSIVARIFERDEKSGIENIGSENSQILKLSFVEKFNEGAYVVTAPKNVLAGKNSNVAAVFPELPGDILKSNEQLNRIYVSSVGELGRILSRFPTNSMLGIQQVNALPKEVGSHFVSNGKVMLSLFATDSFRDNLSGSILEQSSSGLFFKGMVSDFVPPANVLGESMPGVGAREFYVFSKEKTHKIDTVVLRRHPGVVGHLGDAGASFFRNNPEIDLKNVKGQRGDGQQYPRPARFIVSPKSLGRASIVLVDRTGQISFPTFEKIGISLPPLTSVIPQSQIPPDVRSKIVESATDLQDETDAEQLFALVKERLNASLLLAIVEEEQGDLVVFVVGKSMNGNVLSRQIEMDDFRGFQKQFYSAFDYNGVVSGIENHWFRARIQGGNFENNHFGVVFAKAGADAWLPAIGPREKPSALIRCEFISGNFCEGKIISLDQNLSEKDLEGAKVRWL